METGDLKKDDFLGKMISDYPLDSPSDNFVNAVMEKVQAAPDKVHVQKPYYLFLKNSWPYFLLSVVVIIVFLTSDLPFLNSFPGKTYFSNFVLPYFASLLSFVKSSFESIRNFSVPLVIIAAGALLVLADYWIFKRPKVRSSMVF